MRVLMISKALIPAAYRRKLAELSALGVELTAICPPAWGGQRLEAGPQQGYTLLIEQVNLGESFHLHYYPHLGRRMAEVQPQIVHIDEEPYNLSTYLALRAARRVGARALFFSWQNLNRRYPPPFNCMERFVLRHADYGLFGSQGALEVGRAKGWAGPAAVIPQFGVDPQLFSPASEEPAERPFTVGYAGRLVPEKGIDLLIKAMAHFPGPWRLRILGAGPHQAELQRLAGIWNHGGGVAFEPPLPSTDMPAWYRTLDALVLPSRTAPNWQEQFGRVLIEAMACGIPVIGARSGAIPEVIDQAGLLFPEGDEQALLQALITLYQRPALALQLREDGRARVLEHFTQARIAQATAAIYAQMLP